MKYILPCLIMLFLVNHINAQKDSSAQLTIGAYGEIYVGHNFSNKEEKNRPYYIYNHKRMNEVNINLAMVNVNYTDSLVRANAALMVGNYAQFNLSSEPDWAQFVYAANIGVKLSKKNNIWIDAGIMPSHIGFESAIGADCWTLTRTVVAENSPYYETGIKFSYTTKDNKLTTAIFVLNGWQNIQRRSGINKPSYGGQIFYQANDRFTLNYSNFIGSDYKDEDKVLRIYNNLYTIFKTGKLIDLIAGFDYGIERANSVSESWYAPVAMIRFNFTDKFKTTLRWDQYIDDKGVILSSNPDYGTTISSISLNCDYQINKKAVWRNEIKYTTEEVFETTKTYIYTSALAIKF